MRHIDSSLPVLFALLALLQGRESDSGAPRKALPDIVLIVADDLNWEDVDATPTPAIDRLAREGLILREHHSMPVCSPSRAALFYGRWPRRSGIGTIVDYEGREQAKPASELVSLPTLLKARGYRTCLVGKWHLGAADWRGDAAALSGLASAYGPHGAGFDHWLAGSPGNVDPFAGYSDWLRVDDGVVRQESRYCTEQMVAAARDWWGTTTGPKFMAVCLQAPHQPFHAPPPELVPGYAGVPVTNTQKYLQMVGTVDWAVARLRTAFDARNTIFVFVADNGTPAMVNGSGVTAKGTTLRRGVRVPLLLAGPGIEPGESDALVSLVDLPATVYELATGEPPRVQPGMGFEDAISFAPLITRRGRLAPAPRTWLMSEKFDSRGDDFMVRNARWKVRHYRPGPRVFGFPQQHQLFDLSVDPFEQAPVALGGALDPGQAAAATELNAFMLTLPPRQAP